MNIESLREEANRDLRGMQARADIERVRVLYVGRKGKVTELLKSLKELSLEEKRVAGPQLQKLQKEIEEFLAQKDAEFAAQAKKQEFDVTRPGRKQLVGHLNPLTIVRRQMEDIFTKMNFSVVDGPELETEYYNFDALNIPESHPAREMWDTFWIRSKTQNEKKQKENKFLLRTHTSPVQIRFMETHQPPFQIISPGRTFRYEAMDASHQINFYQFEGLMVGKHISVANFKYILETFFTEFFGKKIKFRYRVSYFPFVEPGVEVDIWFGGRWLEVMGAGMVHPKVLEAVEYDPMAVQGFAFGMCIDRLAMIKYNIPDIRLLYSGDMRFTHQFK